jgi:glucose-fructose oxidoreductase
MDSFIPAPPSRRDFLRAASAGALWMVSGCARNHPEADLKRLLAGRPPLGVALVGLGSYSTGQLAPALQRTRLCRLTGVVTGTPQKALDWQARHGLPPENCYDYETMGALADNPAIDIVYVVTPPGLHRDHAVAAALADKHVLCEKPMANTVAECDEIIAACAAAGVRLSMGYRLPYHPYHEEVTRLATPAHGGPFPAMRGGHGYFQADHSWRMTQALGGGGQLMNVGIYVIQSALMARGGEMPVAVTAEEPPKTRPELFAEVEETLHFTLEWADGSRCEGRTSGTENYNFFEAESPRAEIVLQPAFSYDGLRMTVNGTARAPLDGFNQQAAQMDAFAAAILGGEPSLVPGEMGRRDMVIISAIYEAARTGRRVLIEA